MYKVLHTYISFESETKKEEEKLQMGKMEGLT